MPDLGIEEYQVIINVLGLRGLISTGLLPVKKAYVKFSVKSLLPPAQAKAVADIFTVPDEGGCDPNIRTTIKFSVNFSCFPHYCPSMTCTTLDKLYFDGMKQPILGTFLLELGTILNNTRKNDSDLIKNFDKYNEKLKLCLAQKKGAKADQTIVQILQDINEARGSNVLRVETLKKQAEELKRQEIKVKLNKGVNQIVDDVSDSGDDAAAEGR
jgi:hypothetical protein